MFGSVYVEEHFPTQINSNVLAKIALSIGSFILFQFWSYVVHCAELMFVEIDSTSAWR